MRSHGVVGSPGGLGLNGHACWGFEGRDDFRAAAATFLTEGLELGQALMFVGGPEAEQIVRTADPMASMVTDGSLQVAGFETIYPGRRRMSDSDQWSAYAAAVDQARTTGFSGLRVLAEVTALASGTDAWRAHALWESYADRRMADGVLAALCCFDRTALSREGMATIASAHPVVDRRLEELVPFRLFGESGAIALAGEVDTFSSETLRHLLDADHDEPADQVLDVGDLTFIDHTGMRALHEYGHRLRAQGFDLTVRGGPPAFKRLAALLGVVL